MATVTAKSSDDEIVRNGSPLTYRGRERFAQESFMWNHLASLSLATRKFPIRLLPPYQSVSAMASTLKICPSTAGGSDKGPIGSDVTVPSKNFMASFVARRSSKKVPHFT